MSRSSTTTRPAVARAAPRAPVGRARPRAPGDRRGRAAAWLARAFGRGSVHRRVLTAAAIVGFFTLAAKVLSAGRELVVAHQFGTSDQVDAFVLALTFPAFAITLIGGALNAALLPAYVDVRQREGEESAQRLFTTLLLLSLCLLVVAATTMAVLLPLVLPLLSARFSPAKLALTLQLSYVLLPTVVIAGTTMTCTAVLNARERFGAPAAAALAIPLVSTAALLLLGPTHGIHALAWGFLAGTCVEALLVLWAVGRERVRVVPRFHGLTPHVRRVGREFVPMFAGAIAMGSNPVVDSMVAARLHAGSLASLGYGWKLVAFAVGIGSVSLGAAVFPHFSRLASLQDWKELAATIRVYTLAVMAVTVPATIAAIALSERIVRLLYQRGAFGPEDTARVATIQSAYLIGVPFLLTSLVFVRFLSAMSHNRVVMAGAILNCVVNVVADVVLARWLGPTGIALSTSLVYVVSFLFLGWWTWRRLAALRASGPPEPQVA